MKKPCRKCGGNDRNVSGACRACKSAYGKMMYAANKDKVREYGAKRYREQREKVLAFTARWRAENIDRVKATNAKYRAENREKRAAYNAKYHAANPEKHKASTAKWVAKHPEKRRATAAKWVAAHPEKTKSYDAKKRGTPRGTLNNRMSTAIYQSLTIGTKNGKRWETLVGFTAGQLKKHLEKLFSPGMSWENRRDWHIDHIIPVSAFNFTTTDDLDFKRCWTLKNLRPMWAKENLIKHDKLDKPFQPSLILQEVKV